MGVKCQILLNPPEKGVYVSGEPVSGTINYFVDKQTTFKSAKFYFFGKLKGNNDKKESDYALIKKEDFIALEEIILTGNTTVPAGAYQHSFNYILPEELPSTFRDKTCTVSYKISAWFTEPGRFGDKKTHAVTELPVYGKVKPLLDQPLEFQLTKSPFTVSTEMFLVIQPEKAFLKAGENIILECKIRNTTKIPITSIKTKLVSETIYKYDKKSKNVQKAIMDKSDMESEGVAANSEAIRHCIVPTLSNLYSIQHSKLFSREYKVIVTAVLPFPHRNIVMEIPVAIEATDVLDMEVNGKHNNMGCIPYVTSILRNFTFLYT